MHIYIYMYGYQYGLFSIGMAAKFNNQRLSRKPHSLGTNDCRSKPHSLDQNPISGPTPVFASSSPRVPIFQNRKSKELRLGGHEDTISHPFPPICPIPMAISPLPIHDKNWRDSTKNGQHLHVHVSTLDPHWG